MTRAGAGARAGFGLLALAVALFSTVEVVTKWLGGAVPPLRLACVRFLGTGLVLGPWALRRRWRAGRRLGARDAIVFAGLGAVGVSVSIGLFHASLQYLQANAAAILFSSHPVFVAVLAPLLLSERLHRRHVVAVSLGLAGVLAFALERGGFAADTWLGLLLMLGSVLSFALYIVMVKRCTSTYDVLEITGAASLAGGLWLVPVTLVMEGMPRLALSGPQWLAVGHLTLLATAAAYLLFFLGLQRVNASRGSLFFFLKPVLASLLARVWLDERLTLPMGLGTALILAALAMVVVPGGRSIRRRGSHHGRG